MRPRPNAPVIQPGKVTVRHIKQASADDPGAIEVGGAWYVKQQVVLDDFAAGAAELKLGEEGTLSISFPNAAGPDGVLHRERFLIVERGRRREARDHTGAVFYAEGIYRPGDEWLEVRWEGDPPDQPIIMATPTRCKVTRQAVEITAVDGLWLLKKVREFEAGYWCNAPREVFEHYTRAWVVECAHNDLSGSTFNYSTSEQTTGDGDWVYQRGEANGKWVRLRIPPAGIGSIVAALRPTEGGIRLGTSSDDPHRPWRAEMEVAADTLTGVFEYGAALALRMVDTDGTSAASLQINNNGSGTAQSRVGPSTTVADGIKFEKSASYRFVIEGRDRWVFFYLNGEMKAVLQMPVGSAGVEFFPQARFTRGTASSAKTDTADIKALLVRTGRKLFMRGDDEGDLRLPGLPTPGGLIGSYYNDADLVAKHGGEAVRFILNPTRQPYARRLDSKLFFPGTNPATWQPAGAGQAFSVRWTGAIYLDLEAFDYKLMVGALGAASLSVGRTRVGEQALIAADTGVGSVASPWMRAHLQGAKSGWYPITLDLLCGVNGGGIRLLFERSDGASGDAGTSETGSPALSPAGMFEQLVRYESHYDVLKTLSDTFGYQYTCTPRTLESGAFPGEIVPRIREGEDHAYTLDGLEAREIGADLSAEDTADALLVDAAGIADPNGTSQLTAEALNFDELDRHMILHQEYDSASDIGVEALLIQRAQSMLALRGSVLEEVAAMPSGFQQRTDDFPVTGDAGKKLLRWRPGDGVLLDQDDIGVQDNSPRQLPVINKPFVPHGLQAPTVAWRQRTRNMRDFLRQLKRYALVSSRNYQRQIIGRQGDVAGNDGTGFDEYSRVSLPLDLGDVVLAEFVVQAKSDNSPMGIEINGVARGNFTEPVRFPVTAHVAQANPGELRMYARATGGTGTVYYRLELLVAV